MVAAVYIAPHVSLWVAIGTATYLFVCATIKMVKGD
jgi:hypothetical protein